MQSGIHPSSFYIKMWKEIDDSRLVERGKFGIIVKMVKSILNGCTYISIKDDARKYYKLFWNIYRFIRQKDTETSKGSCR